jgi:hypothetical protein
MDEELNIEEISRRAMALRSKDTERIRIDRVSGANHDLIRLLNKPGHDGMTTIL